MQGFRKILRRLKNLKAKWPALRYAWSTPVPTRVLVAQLQAAGFPCRAESGQHITETHVRVVYAQSHEFGAVVIKASTHPSAIEDLQRNYRNLQTLPPLLEKGEFEAPRPLFCVSGSWKTHTFAIFVESRLHGHRADDLTYSGACWELISSCFSKWRLCLASHQVENRAEKRRILQLRLNELSDALREFPEIDGAALLQNWKEAVDAGEFDWLIVGLAHHDFWLGNLILLEKGRIGLIDWGGFGSEEISELDLIHLVLYTHAQRENHDLSKSWMQFFQMATDNDLLYRYYDERKVRLLLSIYWLSYSAAHWRTRRNDGTYRLLREPMWQIRDWIGAGTSEFR